MCSSDATRASSGPELEQAVARGIASAGGTAVLGGVLPTPAVALLADDLGVVVSASHNPPEYNGVKLFRGGGKLVDEQEEEIEALFDARAPGGGSIESRRRRYRDATSDHVIAHFGSDLTGLRIGVDCANGAFSELAPRRLLAARRRGAHDRRGARRLEHQRRLRRDRPSRPCNGSSPRESLDLGVAFDGDGDRMLAVDERGEAGRRRPDPRDPRARTSASTSSPSPS